jgi:hypothetical protein
MNDKPDIIELLVFLRAFPQKLETSMRNFTAGLLAVKDPLLFFLTNNY